MRVVDTSVAVDHLRGHAPATRLLDELVSREVALIASELVRFELLAGSRDQDLPRLERFFEVLDWVPVTDRVTRQAGAFARTYRGSDSGIDVADFLIAATVTVLEAPLLTTNVRHFPMIEGLTKPY